MPQDKSIISLPSTSKTVVLPNVINNLSKVRYNEGVYISDSSTQATYQKSVIRIYKNPNDSKKVYFAAKDTSLLENYVLSLVDEGATKDSSPNTFRSDAKTAYYWSRTETEESYQDFALFSQPRNLEFNGTEVIGKNINFYSLPLTQVSYMSSLNSDAEVNINFINYGIFLKAKSAITDYQNYDLYETNKARIGRGQTSGSFLNKVGLYEKFLFNNITASSDIEDEFEKIQPLSDRDLQLTKTVKILNVNKVLFSDFVENRFDNMFMFLTENSAYTETDKAWEASGYYHNMGVQVEAPNYVVFIYNSEDDQKQVFQLLHKNFSTFSITQDGIDNEYTFDSIFGNNLIALTKKNNFISNIQDLELFNIVNNEKEFRFYDTVNTDRSDYYEGQLQISNNKIFNLNKKLFSLEDYVTLYKTSVSNVNNFITDVNETDPDITLSNVYVFKDSFDYSKYGFIPTDFDETIYEFELDQELDFQNGAFVVAEIE